MTPCQVAVHARLMGNLEETHTHKHTHTHTHTLTYLCFSKDTLLCALIARTGANMAMELSKQQWLISYVLHFKINDRVRVC